MFRLVLLPLASILALTNATGEQYYEKHPGQGCNNFEAKNLGSSISVAQTAELCGAVALLDPQCTGTEIMWSPYSADYAGDNSEEDSGDETRGWGCRCCTDNPNKVAYTPNENWNIWDKIPDQPPVMFSSPPCAVDEVIMKIIVNTDNFPTETSWKVHDECNNGEELAGGVFIKPNSEEVTEVCVPANNKFRFTINDWFGDGLCCAFGDGNYTVELDGVVEAISTGEFQDQEVSVFGECAAVATFSPPTPAPATSFSVTRTKPGYNCRYFRAQNLGTSFLSPEECGLAAAQEDGCSQGHEIMWSPQYSSEWGCWCCGYQDDTGYTPTSRWDIYQWRET